MDYLDLCKALDTGLHGVLVTKMEENGCDGWTTHSESCGQWLDVQVKIGGVGSNAI